MYRNKNEWEDSSDESLQQREMFLSSSQLPAEQIAADLICCCVTTFVSWTSESSGNARKKIKMSEHERLDELINHSSVVAPSKLYREHLFAMATRIKFAWKSLWFLPRFERRPHSPAIVSWYGGERVASCHSNPKASEKNQFSISHAERVKKNRPNDVMRFTSVLFFAPPEPSVRFMSAFYRINDPIGDTWSINFSLPFARPQIGCSRLDK